MAYQQQNEMLITRQMIIDLRSENTRLRQQIEDVARASDLEHARNVALRDVTLDLIKRPDDVTRNQIARWLEEQFPILDTGPKS